MVVWFLREIMKETIPIMIPPQLNDGRDLELLRLYHNVKKEGGQKIATTYKIWPVIAVELG
jgi:hypothetical protein